jgi:hypothetical protein
MKKLFISFSLVFVVIISAMGQLRHVKGISNAGVTCGITGNGNMFGLGYSHYFKPNWIWNINATYEAGEIESTMLKHYFLNGGVDYTIFETGEFFYFNAGLSLFAGLEKLSSHEPAVVDIKNFTFGPSGNVNTEIYFTSKFLLQIKAEQYYSPLSKLGKWFPVYSLSLKYCF